jgi:hypothetical protein
MDGKKLIFSLIFFFGMGLSLLGQTFSYTYVDPCTGISNTVQLSSASGTVNMFYGGQIRNFTYAELQQGAYESWVASINSQAPPGSNPCAGNGGQVTNNFNNNLGNNTAQNITNITGIVSMAASLGSSTSNISTGGISNTNTGNSNNSTNSGGNSSGGSNGGSTGGGGNSGGGSTGGGNSGGGGSTGGGGGSTGGGGGSTGSGGGSTGGGNPSSGVGGTDGGSVNSGGTTEGSNTSEMGGVSEQNNTTASGGDSESSSDSGGGGGGKRKKNQEKVGRGSLIGTGDIVVIRNGNDIRKSGGDNLKINSSLTHVNTKQTLIKGLNLNYQTGENVANITLFGSYKHKNFMGIFSNSTMTNFKTDWFNTSTVLGSQKANKFTFMLGTNYTFGQLGKGDFSNWSVVGGTFTNFKGGKSIGANVMLLGVYSPYIFYYEGQWYKSGILLIPLINTDIKLTDKFKWSISFAGTYQWNQDILNFQISTGTKLLL